MKNKIDTYLELANQARLAHVPLDKSEAETLLKTKMSGTAQNIFKRFYNFFGRHLFMTITSFVGIILTGLYLSTPFQVAEHKDFSDKKIQNKTFAQNTVEKKTKVNIISDVYIPVKEEEVKPKYKITSLKEYDIKDITWNLVIFKHEDWSFDWKNRIEHREMTNKDGNHSISISISQIPLEDKYLIKVSKQLEDSLRNIVDLSEIKSICNLEIEDYFDQLAKIGNKLSNIENDKELLRMVNLYAHINRKFLNNPAEMMKIKSKGLILPKSTLEKLGLIFTDSTISIPQDGFYKNTVFRKYELDLFRSEKINTDNLTDNDIFIKKNIIFEWDKNYRKYDNDTTIKRSYSYTELSKRQGFDNLSTDWGDNTNNKTVIFKTQSYFDIFGIIKNHEFRLTCPVLWSEPTTTDYFDAILYHSNEATRKLYDNFSEVNKVEFEIKSKDSTFPKEELNNLKMNYDKKRIIIDNMKTAIKYRYFIPVNVQIPYNGKTKAELETMKDVKYITLWYYPNDEFMQTLPDDIKQQLKKEIELADAVQKGDIQPEKACEEVKAKESLLGLCNLTEKAISNLNVYPNPAKDQINIKFDILDKGFYKIILSDASGHYVKDLSDWKENEKGQINQNFNLSELENGFYLIQVITERSEKLVAKFVIKN